MSHTLIPLTHLNVRGGLIAEHPGTPYLVRGPVQAWHALDEDARPSSGGRSKGPITEGRILRTAFHDAPYPHNLPEICYQGFHACLWALDTTAYSGPLLSRVDIGGQVIFNPLYKDKFAGTRKRVRRIIDLRDGVKAAYLEWLHAEYPEGPALAWYSDNLREHSSARISDTLWARGEHRNQANHDQHMLRCYEKFEELVREAMGLEEGE